MSRRQTFIDIPPSISESLERSRWRVRRSKTWICFERKYQVANGSWVPSGWGDLRVPTKLAEAVAAELLKRA